MAVIFCSLDSFPNLLVLGTKAPVEFGTLNPATEFKSTLSQDSETTT